MSVDSFMQAVEEFNQRKFYQCHDSLEAIWVDSPEIDKRFYQGLLQIAVACHHLSNLNLRGAIILLGEGIQRLRDYLPDYKQIDLSQLLEDVFTLLTKLQQIEPSNLPNFVDALFNKSHASDRSNQNTGEQLECQLPKLLRVKIEPETKELR